MQPSWVGYSHNNRTGSSQSVFKKEQYALAPKCQVQYLYYAWDFIKWNHNLTCSLYLQAELNAKESQLIDLRQNISTQQSATSKAQQELRTALEDMEKLKKDFKTERSNWDSEREPILKRAEDAEAGLKHQINSMTSAVFGK